MNNHYNEFYANGGFKYDDEKSIKFIEENTIIPKIGEGLTLLDVGCGDGFWSKILAKYCKHITGIDISEKGIEIAKQKLPTGNFIVGDALKHTEKYDILFCRSPSIFNRPVDSDDFRNNIKYMMSLTKKYFIYTEYFTKELINNFNGRWHHKDPYLVFEEIKKYGETTLKVAGSAMIIETKINEKSV